MLPPRLSIWVPATLQVRDVPENGCLQGVELYGGPAMCTYVAFVHTLATLYNHLPQLGKYTIGNALDWHSQCYILRTSVYYCKFKLKNITGEVWKRG